MASRTRIDDPDLVDLLRGIDEGRVALPNFQRDFDWSDADVRALLATVLNGWPMGSLLLIDGSTETKDFYAPRPFAHAPSLRGLPEIIVLDGQQRLTSLYTSLYQRSDLVYAVHIGDELDWDRIDSVDKALRTFKKRVWDQKYPTPAVQWANHLMPIGALKSASDFYAWRDAAHLDEEDLLAVSDLYRSRLSGLHRYRVPALRIEKGMPPAAVARIFERVNKTGQRLGPFDLMVAKSFTPIFNLRSRWEEARERYPRIARFYLEDGLAPLQVIALRVLNDVRSSAVLELTATAIHDNWDSAVAALDDALQFAEAHLGVVKAEWMPYASLMVVLGALALDGELEARRASLQGWFWRAVFSGRYSVGSNTTAVADFKALRLENGDVSRSFTIDQTSLLESTKQANGALHRAWLCAMAAKFRGDRGVVDGEIEARSIVKRGPVIFDEPAHLLSLGFCLTTGSELVVDGPFLDPPELLADAAGEADLIGFLQARAEALVLFLSDACGARVALARLEESSEGISD